MKKALKFDLIGKYAFFKNPESNTGTEFSFEHIHKPSLLGVLGCILGMAGKSNITKEKPLPEYYKELKDIKVAIVPSRPTFYKFKETITNTTGFANENSTQVLTRKVLQDVCWTIYILRDNIQEQYWNELCYLLEKHESKYPLYLGNNSYKAKINNFEIIKLNNLEDLEYITINSLYKENDIEEFYDYTEDDAVAPYDLEMYFPDSLNELNLYKYEWYKFSNLMLNVKKNDNLYTYEDKILYFV